MFRNFLIVTFITISQNHQFIANAYLNTPNRIVNNLYDSFLKFSENLRRVFSVPFKRIYSLRSVIDKFMEDTTKRDAGISPRYTLNGRRKNHGKSAKLAPEMIIEYGHKVEIHTVITSDGYHLTLHRIPPPDDTMDPKIALLHHGLFGSSDDWILLGNKALPFILSHSGYDVWLGNARGNRYSRNHISLNKDSPAFWNYSWHEIGTIDLAATIDYVRKATFNFSQIDFIGHSMGGTALVVLLSTHPRYARVLRCAMLLGPLVFMYSVQGPLRLLANIVRTDGYKGINFLGEDEFIEFPSKIVDTICKGDKEMCDNPVLFLANSVKGIRNETLKKLVLSHAHAGGSTKTLVHYCQLVNSGQFRMFDYGTSENVKRYGMRSPASYSLSDVDIPIGTFISADDWLSTSTDALTFLPTLPYVIFTRVIQRKGFTHTDFLWAEDAPKLVYHVLLQVLEEIGLNGKGVSETMTVLK